MGDVVTCSHNCPLAGSTRFIGAGRVTNLIMTDYLQGLNDRQREAVLHIDGPIMIVAGAGSGKTKVLTTRIIHLMAHGVDAFNILALTFTNKAAKEMKERVERILGNGEARTCISALFTPFLQEYSGSRPIRSVTPKALPSMIPRMQKVSLRQSLMN